MAGCALNMVGLRGKESKAGRALLFVCFARQNCKRLCAQFEAAWPLNPNRIKIWEYFLKDKR
jgi:hypothetical protein